MASASKAAAAAAGRAMEGITLVRVGNRQYRLLAQHSAATPTVIAAATTAAAEETTVSETGTVTVEALSTVVAVVASERLLRPKRPPYTHFLSLPLRHTPVVDALAAWQREVLDRYATLSGLDSTVMVAPSSFHLTLGMLSLPTRDAVDEASQLLRAQSARLYDLLRTQTLLVTVQGLRMMERSGRKRRAGSTPAGLAASGARDGPSGSSDPGSGDDEPEPGASSSAAVGKASPIWADVLYFDVQEPAPGGRLLPMIGRHLHSMAQHAS